jgi:hypothetical protein
MALLYCTDYVRIIIAIFMTLDHVHFENEILFSFFTLPTVDCGCLPLLAAHHRYRLPLSNIYQLATILPAPTIPCYLCYLLVGIYFL